MNVMTTAPSNEIRDFQILIDGKWRDADSAKWIETENPFTVRIR